MILLGKTPESLWTDAESFNKRIKDSNDSVVIKQNEHVKITFDSPAKNINTISVPFKNNNTTQGYVTLLLKDVEKEQTLLEYDYNAQDVTQGISFFSRGLNI